VSRLAGALSNVNPIDEGMGSAEGTQSSSLAEVASSNLYNGTIIDGCWGETEGTKSSSSDVDNGEDIEGNLSNGIIDDGSGAADGTKSSSSANDANAGNLYTEALIDDGSGTMEGTKSLPSVDVYCGDLNSGAAEGTKSRSSDDGDRLGSFLRNRVAIF